MIYSNEQYRQGKRNNGARSRNHRLGKAIIIIYSGCVYFSFFTQYETRLLRTVLLFVASDSAIFFHVIS